MSDTNIGTLTNSSGTEKSKLELEKLQLEVKRLRQPFRTSLREFGWKDITAIIVALTGVVLVCWTGIFNVRQERLGLATDKLEVAKNKLEEGNADLEKTKVKLTAERQNLTTELQTLRGELSKYQKERAALQRLSRTSLVSFSCQVSLYHGPDDFEVSFLNFNYDIPRTPGDNSTFNDLLDKLRDVPRLSSLKLIGCALSRAQVEKINSLGQLTSLVLIHCKLSDDLLEPLTQLNKLMLLGLAHNNIQHPKCLYSMSSLDRVDFGHTAFDDEGLRILTSTAHRIRELWICNTRVSDSGIESLNNLHELSLLWLSSPAITSAGLIHFKLPHLELQLDDKQLIKAAKRTRQTSKYHLVNDPDPDPTKPPLPKSNNERDDSDFPPSWYDLAPRT
jgi:hypothetical protein